MRRAAASTAVHSAGRWEHPFGQQAHTIDEVVDEHHGLVLLRTAVGGTRSAQLSRVARGSETHSNAMMRRGLYSPTGAFRVYQRRESSRITDPARLLGFWYRTGFCHLDFDMVFHLMVMDRS